MCVCVCTLIQIIRYFENKEKYFRNVCSLGVGVQISWLKNATLLLSTEAPSQLIPVNLVTRPSLSARPGTNDRHGPNELPDDDDAVVIEAEVTEPAHITTISTMSGKMLINPRMTFAVVRLLGSFEIPRK